jgi:long-chain acyl-CoA synthetase
MEVKTTRHEGFGSSPRTARPVPASEFPATLPALVRLCATRFGDATFLARRSARGGDPISFAQLADDIDRVSAGLAAHGVGHGERVGLIAENCCEWLLADLGTASLGAIDVPRGTDTAPAERRFILDHSQARFVFVETDAAAREVLAERAALPAIETVCTLQASTEVDGVLTFTELLAAGDAWQREHPGRLDELRAKVRPDDLLTIVYTSGTTADPKGVMLTQANVISNIRMVNSILHVDGNDSFLSVLPAWHMYERILNYLALAYGAQVIYTDRRRIKDDLASVRPTAFAAVPRIWENLHDGIVNHCRKQTGLKGRLLRRVLDTCARVGSGSSRPLDRLLYAMFERTLLPKIRAVTGGRLRIAVSGGGSLPAHVDECMLGLGIPLLNGYGLTETSPVAAVRLPCDNRPGTIGPPLPETSIEIRDPQGQPLPRGEIGLIWIKGPQVMRGYYRNPERTREVLDANGWFNSGDLGRIEPDGHIRITGRAKDTIVLAGGENVEPEPLETAIKTSPLIDQAVVVGQDRKQLGAILVAMPESLEAALPRAQWGVRDGELRGAAVQDLYRRELDRALSRERGFRPFERIGAFRVILDPLTVENGLLTQTMKIRRHVVHERLAALIDEMFAQ